MTRKWIPLAALLAATSGAALAQTDVQVKQKNDNVTKVDGTVNGADVKGMTNPAQTRVKARASDGSQVSVRAKPPKD